MCAVILIFAFTMSLIISFIERIISSDQDEIAHEKEPEEVFVTRKSE